MKSLVAAIPADELTRRSHAVCARLSDWVVTSSLPPARGAIMVFAAIPTWGEVDLASFVDRLLAEGRGVCMPHVDWQTQLMSPRAIRDRARDILVDARGIPSPRGDLPVLEMKDIDVVVAPGLAFDARGGRLGRGKGHYDRFLESLRRANPAVRTVAAVLDEQVVDRVPLEPHDKRVDAIVTDMRTIEVSRS